MFTKKVILTEYDAITAKLSYILNQMNGLCSVDVKPGWCDLSDAGPVLLYQTLLYNFRMQSLLECGVVSTG